MTEDNSSTYVPFDTEAFALLKEQVLGDDPKLILVFVLLRKMNVKADSLYALGTILRAVGACKDSETLLETLDRLRELSVHEESLIRRFWDTFRKVCP